MKDNLENTGSNILGELKVLIDNAKQNVTIEINSGLTTLFWQVGNKINNHILKNERAEYGKQIVVTLSRELESKYGRNFEVKNLRRMLQFADQFGEKEIVVTLSRHLSWSHFLLLLPLKNEDAKMFYAKKVYEESWSVRETRKQIGKKSYERSRIASNQVIVEGKDENSIFKDPYILDFLNLPRSYLENDLENAILHDLQKIHTGTGKRIYIRGETKEDDHRRRRFSSRPSILP